MPYKPDPWQEVISALPSFRPLLRIRTVYLRHRLAACGPQFVVAQGAILKNPERITVGDSVFINRRATITARAPITIGSHVLIGPNVVIDSGDHRFSDPDATIGSQGYDVADITIGSDVWIAANAVILSGVTIGDGAVVAAGAVVRYNVPPYSVVAGVPARAIGSRLA